MSTDSSFDLHLPPEMAKIAEQSALYKATKKIPMSFFLAIIAGVFISMGFVFYITITSSPDPVSAPVKFLGGLCFTLGLILVVVCGADLFTSTVLTIIAKASGLISWSTLATNWTVVYLGNLVGALFFAVLIWCSGQIMSGDGQWGLNVLLTADHKMHHTFFEAVCLGTLANMMVCLAVWLSYAGHTIVDKIVAMLLPISMFVCSGFEHSIANMFLIPLAMMIRNFAPDTFWDKVHMTPDDFPALNLGQFISDNLIPVTIGNIIGGGVLVGITYWAIFLRNNKHAH
ncbi:formate transporter FocA [Shimwellia blattae]|uniref:Formate transporter FocA n=1 Tax=Shimwellia blattae (strain ATCC 29907 / DSM 4481 / JCM 1650 / NBRC 105725 / CDC 9005-74) TaxID=630626 RepID=I2BDB5_SHIBC|nr:formate transporter FocA [Shimwellia blattae]AFJ48519.1 putative formate transporter 1 (formate channel 1) [Shimwellia blattae DSM 4481 = NBRC 105725]GAB83113.1 putative formate transporter FocB [Shimwellia blattae DSM 4481 = NBRC 105725]VDY66011.1 Formate channel 1 [Shimwellia blattae]VEC26635.1 Formate channel 1 [Shimwellia blattae]